MLISIAMMLMMGMFMGWICKKIHLPSLTGMILTGIILAKYFEKIHIRDTVKVTIILCISFILVTFEDSFSDVIPFASLIVVMAIGIFLQKKRELVANRLSAKFNKLWVVAEIVLFVLVGATVDIKYAVSAGGTSIVLILCVLVFRMAGVFLCLMKTKLIIKERIFCMIAYTPKATVQAAIGGVPLAMGLSCGSTILTVAVTAILQCFTTNIGGKAHDFNRGMIAFLIANMYKI